jgi:hypothetical protein
MSEQHASDFDLERLLRQALAPVDPSEDFAQRFETTLTSLTDLAAEELESWELGAMRDPRNWIRPVAAVAVGATAGTALVVLRVRANSKKRRASSANPLDYAEQTLKAAADEARKLLDR